MDIDVFSFALGFLAATILPIIDMISVWLIHWINKHK